MQCDICKHLGIEDENRTMAIVSSPDSSHRATIRGKFFDLSGMNICLEHYGKIGIEESVDQAIYAFGKERRLGQ